jgi:hypothetical protein
MNCLLTVEKNSDETIKSKTVLLGAKNSFIPSDTTAIGAYAFAFSIVENVIIPSGVTSIGAHAFSDCKNLNMVTFNATDYAKCYEGDLIFSNAEDYGNRFTALFGADVKYVPNYLFEGSNALENVLFASESVCTTIGEGAFINCVNLNMAMIPAEVTTIGNYAFSGCTGLQLLGYNAKNVKDFVTESGKTNEIFAYAGTESEFGGIVVSFGATVEKIPANLFNPHYNRAYDPAVYLVSFDSACNVKSIGKDAFLGGSDMIGVIFSDTIDKWCAIEFANEYANPLAFAKEFITDLSTDEPIGIKDLVIPEGVTKIGDYAFVGGACFETVTLPSTLTEIGTRAFHGAYNLKSINIPASVTKIGAYAFAGCGALNSVTFGASEGWVAYHPDFASNNKAVTVGDAAANAALLKNTLVGYVWKRA